MKTLIRTVYNGCDGRSAPITVKYYWIPENLVTFDDYGTPTTVGEDRTVREYILEEYGEDIAWPKTLYTVRVVRDAEKKVQEWRDEIRILQGYIDDGAS